MMRRSLPLLVPAALLLILACNMPGAANQADALLTAQALTPTFTSVPTDVYAATPTTGAATAAPTAIFTAVATTVPCNLASFVTDVTVPDNTVFDYNTNFTKTWRLKNVGSCTWTSGYQLVFASGDQMSGPNSQQLTNGTVAPNQTIDVSVDLKSPGSQGTYKGNWQLREPGGSTFALSTGPFWVQIKTSAPAASIPPWPVVKAGNSGPEVAAIQFLLVAHGEALTVDGSFGPITRSKVMNFQSGNGLTADGIVGQATWSKLIIQVKQGSTGQAVRAVQHVLNNKFGYSLTIDGIFGPDTNNAVKQYQGDHGLDVDGIVGPQTWRSMMGE